MVESTLTNQEHCKIIFGQTGQGKSTLLNCISSLGHNKGMKTVFDTSSLADSCTSDNLIKKVTVRLPESGDYGVPHLPDGVSETGFDEFEVQLFDTAGAACTTGKEIQNHVAIYRAAKENPASALMICSSSDRLNKIIQDEMKFCLTMYGP